jgi:hypothetical protein
MILHATHTHFYPGHHGTLSGVEQLDELETPADCLVEFSDGSAAEVQILALEKDWRLQVAAYRTAAGTAIPAKRWLMRIDENEGRLRFRILARAPGDS